jgi:CRP-like cAMP-binding protein
MSRGGNHLTTAGPGSPLGALGVLARTPLHMRGTADVDTVTLELDTDSFLETCEDQFVIVHALLRYMAGWVVTVNRREGMLGPPSGDGSGPRRLLGGDLDLVERIFYLRRFPSFADASINALSQLARGLTEVHFEAGVPLWVKDDPSPYALLVVDGEIDCSGPEGGPRFRALPGWGLGHMEALAEVPRWYDAVTASRVVALHGTMEGLIDVFEDNTEMAMGFLALLARGILTYLDRRGPEAVPYPA